MAISDVFAASVSVAPLLENQHKHKAQFLDICNCFTIKIDVSAEKNYLIAPLLPLSKQRFVMTIETLEFFSHNWMLYAKLNMVNRNLLIRSTY